MYEETFFWIGIIFTLAYMWSSQVTALIAFPLALSAVALTISEINKVLARYNNG